MSAGTLIESSNWPPLFLFLVLPIHFSFMQPFSGPSAVMIDTSLYSRVPCLSYALAPPAHFTFLSFPLNKSFRPNRRRHRSPQAVRRQPRGPRSTHAPGYWAAEWVTPTTAAVAGAGLCRARRSWRPVKKRRGAGECWIVRGSQRITLTILRRRRDGGG